MKLKIFISILLAGIFFTATGQITITGTVTDAKDGTSVIGANIVIQGTSKGTVTDIDGKYSIVVPDANTSLVFSFIGYSSQTIKVEQQTTINVSLQEDVMNLDEVVVTGYGKAKKKDLTGSVATLKGDDLNKAGATTPEQLIQGKISGVQIVANSGEPGAGSVIRIRGASTMRAKQQPLYVVDGVPLDMESVAPDGISGSALGGAPSTSPLTSINPNDIESIDVLKDASAAAIYGSRGANGVIIITTKRGKEGTNEVNYSVTGSISNLPKQLDVLSGTEWAKFRKDSLKTTENNFGANTNWQDQIFRTAYSQDHNLSLSGGNAKSNYRASMNYTNQKGIIKTSELQRYAGRFNMTQKALRDKITFETNFSGSQVVEHRPPVGATGYEGDLLLNALQANPTWPVRDSTGAPFQGNTVYKFKASDRNPLAMLEYTNDMTRTTSLLGNLNATVDIISGLNYKINFGLDYANANRFINQSQKLSYMKETNGRGQINNKEIYNYLVEHTLNYNKTFGVHNIGLLAGYSYQEFYVRRNNSTGGNYTTDAIDYSNRIEAGSSQTNWSIFSRFDPPVGLQSYFGRVNYNLMEKYLITATLRADGSTKFGKNKKYGYFPSFAAGWRMSEEEFIKSLNVFSNLKLRLGWGQTGNSEIGTKWSQFLYEISPNSKAIINGTTVVGYKVSRTPNPDVSWETTTSTNLGLDFGILKGRLSGSIDAFKRVTTNLLLQTPAAPLSPSPEIVRNLDSVEVVNKGLEISLNGVIASSKAFSWDITGNIAFLKNNVEGLAKQVFRTGAAQGQGLTGEYVQVIANNQPMNVFYGVKIDSLGSRRTNKGIPYYIKSKAKTTRDSLMYLGDPQPKFTWSISNNLKYKNFDLSIFIEGVQGNKIFNNTALLMDKSNFQQSKNTLKYLLEDKIAINYIPRVSNRYVEDGSYMRLSSVTLGYNFKFQNTSMIKNLRVYASGSNLLLITNYHGYDPDVTNGTRQDYNGINSFGIDITSYPKARTYSLGLNVTF